jgi:hypothetical protein
MVKFRQICVCDKYHQNKFAPIALFRDTMTRGPLILILAFAGVLVFIGITNVNDARKMRDEARTIRALAVAWDLMRTANSTNLTGIGTEFRADLAAILSAPTDRIALVGDEPPPRGDGTACSRLILTNTQRQTLHLRLQEEPGSGKFHLLSYWRTTEPSSPANRN